MPMSAPELSTRSLTPLTRIACGGVVGAAFRWGLGEAIVAAVLPVALLVANTMGCALLGYAPKLHQPTAQRVLGAGVAGGLTSMSALALWLAMRLDAGDRLLAAGWCALFLVLGAVGFLAGDAAARRASGPRHEVPL
jgi:fluoride ion exporter CrcB/FEX